MDDETRVLISILSATDAIFLPQRRWSAPVPANTYAARKLFLSVGVDRPLTEKTEAARRAAARSLEELAAAGKVSLTRPGNIKALFVKLTDAAEADTRRLLALAPLEQSLVELSRIAKLSDRFPKTLDRQFIRETALTSEKCYGLEATEEDRAPLAVLAEALLPALARWFMVSNSDIRGRVSYAVTAAGWDLLDKPLPSIPKLGKWTDDAVKLYYACRHKCWHQLAVTVPDTGEIGFLPLPASMNGDPTRNLT